MASKKFWINNVKKLLLFFFFIYIKIVNISIYICMYISLYDKKTHTHTYIYICTLKEKLVESNSWSIYFNRKMTPFMVILKL